jgi:hypothetical protein
LNWSRNAAGETLVNATVTTFVVEWGSQWGIQHVNVAGSNGGEGADASSEYTTAVISGVIRSNSWIWATGTRADAGIGDCAEACLVTLGSRLEVEVTDFGKRATREHFKSLGFDFGLEAEVTNRTLRALIDGDDYFSNLEYSEEDWSGYVQYIVDGRYLMELQLERLPFESFQTLEDRDGLFRTLLQYVSK